MELDEDELNRQITQARAAREAATPDTPSRQLRHELQQATTAPAPAPIAPGRLTHNPFVAPPVILPPRCDPQSASYNSFAVLEDMNDNG